MSAQRDRQLIGKLIEREVESRMSWAAFASLSNVSRATLYRAKDGDPQVTVQTFRRIERALGLPYDTMASVGAHDFDVLVGIGVDKDLVEWLRRTAAGSSSAENALHTSRKHGSRATAPVSDEG